MAAARHDQKPAARLIKPPASLGAYHIFRQKCNALTNKGLIRNKPLALPRDIG